MSDVLKKMKEALDKKTSTLWGGSANAPFYAILDKPAPSLSHSETPTSRHWRVEDVVFVLQAANGGVQALFDKIEQLEKSNEMLKQAYDLLKDAE